MIKFWKSLNPNGLSQHGKVTIFVKRITLLLFSLHMNSYCRGHKCLKLPQCAFPLNQKSVIRQKYDFFFCHTLHYLQLTNSIKCLKKFQRLHSILNKKWQITDIMLNITALLKPMDLCVNCMFNFCNLWLAVNIQFFFFLFFQFILNRTNLVLLKSTLRHISITKFLLLEEEKRIMQAKI